MEDEMKYEETYKENMDPGDHNSDAGNMGDAEEDSLPGGEIPPEKVEEEISESPEGEESIASLKEQIEGLKRSLSLLEAAKAESERLAGELGEFYGLFPSVQINTLPDEVWESVKKGVSLAASYALYERKQTVAEQRAMEANRKNASLSAGSAGIDTSKEFFTPSEVKSMSRADVRRNYSKIVESMKRWN